MNSPSKTITTASKTCSSPVLSKMAKGPSPLIPLLLVFTLGLLLHGETMMGYFSSALETAQDTSFFIVPVLTVLVMYYTTQTFILPAVTIALMIYLVTKILLGPLFLIFLLCLTAFLGSSSSLQWQYSYRSAVRINGGSYGDEFGGWGWLLLLLLVFLALHGVFSFAEGNEWAFALLAVLVFVAYNFSND